ncbi:MAG: flagellar motor protein [Alphaproteobacteria bacterium]|nr:flagellar motor protein [Alphaproteobacteria bacterium]
MDFLSLVGLILGFGSIAATMLIDGGSLGALVQLSAMIIVGGGTVGAVLVQTPLAVFLRGCKMAVWVFFPPPDDRRDLVKNIVEWLRIARREFILSLDPVAEEQSDPFLRQGLRLVVDGIEAAQIRTLLESAIATQEHEEMLAGEMFEAMGGYSPTVGILGAVMGLITVMSHLEDPSKLGPGIATAFVATVYGVAAANLLFLPIGSKLKVLVRQRMRRLEMITEGMVGIAIMEQPMQFEMRLRSLLDAPDKEAADHSGDDAVTRAAE